MGYILVDHPNPHTAQGGYPRRGGHKPSGTCIMHTSEGNWRAGVGGLTRLLQIRADHGSYHVGVDWDEIAWYYPWEWEAWQDLNTNNWAVGISAACKTSDWGTMPADIEEGYYRNLAVAAADFVLYMKRVYNVTVPLVRISGEQARARKPGFCAHGDSGVARSDPGRNFEWDRFFRYTKEILDGPKPEEDDKMLIIAKMPNQHEVWIGDGITRRHIPNPQTLLEYQLHARNGALKIFDGGKVQSMGSLESLGEPVLPRYFKNQYGSILDANDQLSFIDLNVNNHAKEIKDTLAKLASLLKTDEAPATE